MSKNDITGDRLVSRANSDTYEKNFDAIFDAKCSTCDGSGGYQYEDSDGSLKCEPCPSCDGTGKLYDRVNKA